MAITTTNITGDIALPDGTIPSKSSVTFAMTGFDTDASSDATIAPRSVTSVLSDTGALDVDLWANEDGERTTFYNVRLNIYNGNSPKVFDVGKIEVPTTGGPYDLNDLLPIAPPSGATVEEYIAQLAAAVAEAEAAAERAEDAVAHLPPSFADSVSTNNVYPSTAFGIGDGVIGVASLVSGSGGTDGTFDLAFSGGVQVGAPIGRFTVEGGVVTYVTINLGGYYTSGVPDISFAASAGLTGASATAVMGPNTPVGDYFSVPSSGDDAMVAYRVDAGPVATEIARIPSTDGVFGLAARDVGYIVAPDLSDALSHILKIELYKSVSGVDVTIPTRMCVREVARDGLDRFRLRLAEFDGVSTYTELATENNGGGASINVAGYTGQVWMDLLTSGTGLGPANDTVVGRVLVDFKTGVEFGTYAGTIDYADGGIFTNRQQTGTRFTNDVNELIDSSSAINVGGKIPFSDDMVGENFLRQAIRSIWLYGMKEGHEYAVSTFVVEEFSGIPLTRFRFEIYDVTGGATACSMSYQVSSAPGIASFIANIPDRVKLNDYSLGSETHVYAVADIDWSVVSDFFANVGGTTMVAAGIHPDRCLSDEQIADYLDADRWDEVTRCGSGETYTTLRAAVEATYSDLTGSTLIKGSPICEEAHYHNRRLVDVIEDADFTATGLYLPDQVDLRGNGMDRTIVRRENTDPEPLIEMRASGKMSDMTLISETASEYCIHSDDFNRNASGDDEQNTRLRQSFKRLRLQGATGHNGWLFGCGISSGQVIEFEDVVGEHIDASATEPAFGFHNSGPTLSNPALKASYKPSEVIMYGCSSPDQTSIELSTLEPSAKCSLTLADCEFNMIRVTTSSGDEVLSDLALDRNAWRIGGRYEGAFLRFDPVGENVLKTTAGQTPSGTAAALIFGTTDELGRGDKWIGDGNVYDLGERLGDCSSVNKTLTVGGQTHTFTEDEATKNNTTLLSEINATITSNPLSIVDIQLEWVPDAAPKRRMNNNTGSTIPKGRFVKFTGASTVALCGADEWPDGWTHRDILNGDDGQVVLTRKIANEYLDNASSSTGQWGITSNGEIDYAASVKLGRTIGGIVTLHQ